MKFDEYVQKSMGEVSDGNKAIGCAKLKIVAVELSQSRGCEELPPEEVIEIRFDPVEGNPDPNSASLYFFDLSLSAPVRFTAFTVLSRLCTLCGVETNELEVNDRASLVSQLREKLVGKTILEGCWEHLELSLILLVCTQKDFKPESKLNYDEEGN